MTNKARKWLSKKGYETAYGARPLGRVVQENIKKQLADKILFGDLVMGGEVLVDVKKDKIVIQSYNTDN